MADGYRAMTLGRAVRTAAIRNPDKIALRHIKGGISYRQLNDGIDRIAAAAQAAGLSSGDRVALLLGNEPEYFEIVLGLSDAGIIVVTLNPALTSQELSVILADCTPEMAIGGAEGLSKIEDPAIRKVCVGEELDGWMKGNFAEPVRAADERATFMISYTSGTTGQPKGTLLSHRSRFLTALAMAGEYGCFGPEHVFLTCTPLFHGAGFAYGIANLIFGGTIILHPGFDAEAVLGELSKAEVTGIFVVPTILRRLLDKAGGAKPPHTLRAMICNAAALPAPLKSRAVDIFGQGILHETYGSTEAGIVTNMRPATLLERPNSVGKSFALAEVEIRDAAGELAAVDQIGMLFSRSPYHFNGYLNRPDETSETMVDGWINVGDLASYDADGFITIVGRAKDMIITGGINVYPSEIEAVIAKLPGVAEVAVVGLEDAEWGERIHAFVVGDCSEGMIMEAAQTALSRHKQPRGISFLTELPRNAAGKILKAELRQRAA